MNWYDTSTELWLFYAILQCKTAGNDDLDKKELVLVEASGGWVIDFLKKKKLAFQNLPYLVKFECKEIQLRTMSRRRKEEKRSHA